MSNRELDSVPPLKEEDRKPKTPPPTKPPKKGGVLEQLDKEGGTSN